MEATVVRYPVRTPGWVWPVIFMTGLAASGLAWRVVAIRGLSRHIALAVGLLFLIGLLPVLALLLSRRYRVGEASIDLHADRVEVPRCGRGRVVFPISSLRIARMHIVQELHLLHLPTNVVLDRGEVVTLLGANGVRRSLADRVFVAPGSLPLLLADMALIARGESPRGPDGWAALFNQIAAAAKATRPADPMEARIDDELARLS